MPTPWVKSKYGLTIVGDENELFYIAPVGDGYPVDSYVVRLRPMAGEAPQAMSIPRWSVVGPAVDATYVYWFEQDSNGGRLVRASRDGDGSDATTIATNGFRPDAIVAVGGYVFLLTQEMISGQQHRVLLRVPVTGGVRTSFTPELDWRIIGTGQNELYIDDALPPMGYRHRIVSMTVDGTMQTLADDLPQYNSPLWYTALDRGELFWIGSTANLFRMPVTGGVLTPLATIEHGPFGVTADSIVYAFDELGYKTMPR
jgi:hypothetical protein